MMQVVKQTEAGQAPCAGVSTHTLQFQGLGNSIQHLAPETLVDLLHPGLPLVALLTEVSGLAMGIFVAPSTFKMEN